MPVSAYSLKLPAVRSTAVVFASPHSVRDYSWSFIRDSALDEHSIRSSEDAFVDILFDRAPDHGAPLLAATAPRAFVDLNRSAEEMDPALVEGARPVGHNPRVASGLGVIPRVVSNGRQIYRGKIGQAEAQGRIARFHRPYHARLQALLDESRAAFGQAILIDCHSMPHEALDALAHTSGRRPEVVLGDRFGAACDAGIIARVEAALVSAGLRVSRNAPFAGAYVTQHYGRPQRGQHVVQLEIDRALYMDERTIRPRPDFGAFHALMTGVVAEIAALGEAGGLGLAAE
jgi:N-formylglutamate deformylase